MEYGVYLSVNGVRMSVTGPGGVFLSVNGVRLAVNGVFLAVDGVAVEWQCGNGGPAAFACPTAPPHGEPRTGRPRSQCGGTRGRCFAAFM